MLRIAMAQIRHHRSRSAALLLGIVVAITSFTVLTGSATTTALAVTGVVSQNFTTTYDVLVRPKGTTAAVEQSAGIVAPNFWRGSRVGSPSISTTGSRTCPVLRWPHRSR